MFLLCVVLLEKSQAMSPSALGILDALASKDESSFLTSLKGADWKSLREDDAFIIKVLSSSLQSTPPIKSVEARFKNAHFHGWASYILGKLNSEKPLDEHYLENWVKCLEVEDNCINKIGVEDNHVNVTIYQFGDFTDSEHTYLNEEFGLALCVTQSGKPSFPVFRHTAINESFEFIAGQGYVALFMGG